MRTALWSLVALAGSVVAVPGAPAYYQGANGTDTTSKAALPTIPSYPAPYGSSSKSSKSSQSSRWAYSFSGNSSTFAPSATGGYGPPGYGPPGYGGESPTVTVITSTYETICPGVSTYITSGTTSLSSYTTTSTITEYVTVTLSPSPSHGQNSPNGPGSYPSQSEVSPAPYPTTVYTYTTVYTTSYPKTTTGVSGGKTITRTYESVSTVTSTWYETITLTTVPTGYASEPSPVYVTVYESAPAYVTVVVTETVPGYASESAPAYIHPSESGHVYPSESGPGSGSPTGYGPGESSAVGHTPSVYVTTITQEQTIIVPKTTTAVVGDSTVTKVYSGTSIHTSVYLSTCTEGASTIWTTGHWGTVGYSYTIPLESSTSSSSSKESSYTSPVGPIESTSSSEAPWYPIPSSYSNSSPYGYGTGSGYMSKPTSSKSSSKTYPSGSGSVPTPSGSTSSSKSYPSGSGSVATSPGSMTSSKPTGSATVPTGSGSKPVSSASGSPTKPINSSGSSTVGSPSKPVSSPSGTPSKSVSSPSPSGSSPVSSPTKPVSSPSGSKPVSTAVSSPSKPVSSPVSSPSKPVSTPISTPISSPSVSGSKPVSSPTKRASSSPSVSKPASSTVSKKPSSSSIKSFPSSFTRSKPTSRSTCATPTPTPSSCVPCDGQPGNNPDEYCGYTIEDDWTEVTPKTCRTVEYNFEITNGTVSPDGIERIGFMINGQMPGPKIEANWGDTIVVHVTNRLTTNGSSIHFHGMRQFGTNEMDGVPSITQCALAPGDSMTYTFVATNYGTSWYHSHFAIQTYSGVFGPMVIHGPATAQYDYEQTVVVQDWNHVPDEQLYDHQEQIQSALTLDTGLINGMNVWGADGAVGTTGKRFSMTVVPNKRYRIRLVNTAIQSSFKFYIDGHTFQVIAMDFVPIVPYQTNIVSINIGQRYDLVFTADQTPGNYWMRSDNQNVCAPLKQPTNIKGIVTYEGVAAAIPSSTAYTYTPSCVDEPYASLVPYVARNPVATPDQTINELVGNSKNSANVYKWSLSGTTFQSQWGDPTLYQIYHNGTIPTYSGNLAIEVPNLGEWVYLIIDSAIPTPHPIHLHGHDFFIIAQGTGLYDPAKVVLNTANPPRRDVALMPYFIPTAGRPLGGYLVIAFQADNPGAWLMHCHIGWHNSMGFALQIIEGTSSIKDTVKDSCQLDSVCYNWNSYANANNIITWDSGV